ncbi:NAD(P)/FAD-dependent oxidoreductase [Kangiella sp. HD9-110m-PIT-SAG07]|nr:NAD(P)/FAD-dependent oxidoreductase [Kangiella sp. HD9-110m-PIT-SAG07]
MSNSKKDYDVTIIGAGPAGTLAASRLAQRGVSVVVIEKQHFPRFSIGESLLPQSMVYLQEANLLDAVESAADKLGFQYKNGASFFSSGQESTFDFSQKFSQGPDSTFQVKRAAFDQLLAQQAEKFGADFIFGSHVTDINFCPAPELTLCDEKNNTTTINSQFVLDASGFARVLPRLLDLDLPSDFPVRSSVFSHVVNHSSDINSGMSSDINYDRNKILIETHPSIKDVWYWLIPFSDNTASIGCVAKPEFFQNLEAEHKLSSNQSLIEESIRQTDRLSKLLSNVEIIGKPQRVTGYSSNVKQLYGDHYALLGNAGEFLDPIFSSGVTIAFKSAKLATDCLLKQLNDESVCWETEFAQPLSSGVSTFKAFVHSWYQGQLQDIIQFQQAPDNVREMICSILAGYAWDEQNPFNDNTTRRLNVLGEICAS